MVRTMRSSIVALALVITNLSVACGGSSSPSGQTSVPPGPPEAVHRYPYPAAAVAAFVRDERRLGVPRAIGLCVIGHFEDEIPYDQFSALYGSGALVDQGVQFAADCAGDG